MNRLYTLVIILSILCISQLNAQLFQRASEIPTANYEVGGFGGLVAGVDFDQDGWPEIYALNTNFVDRPEELIPRIYKFEWNGTSWDSVWATVTDIPLQNTWPAMTWGDLDADGKPEIYCGPVNYLDAGINANPARILVYEYPGDGSDNMGVDDGLGGFLPNAKTSIISTDMTELRPIRFVISDIDGDLQDEIIFPDRRANNGEYHFGVMSVDNIPDNGDGSETWTLEMSGLGDFNLTGTNHKWDVAVVDNYLYLFGNDARVFTVKYENNTWQTFPGQSGVAGDNSSFKGAVVADVDNDGSKEIVVGGWFSNKVYLLQQSADTLLSFEIADLGPLGAVRLNGADYGDLDSDGNLDFVFGSRDGSLVKVPIFRVEYQGGDITNPASYVSSVIDSASWDNRGDMDVIVVANVDGDPDDEVLYTQGYSRGNPNDSAKSVIILDMMYTPVTVERENENVPTEFYLAQNYPNPFNPSTVIKFGLNKAANVDLRVYDVLGREIAVLVNNQYMEAGSYNTKFNASGLASGIYIYKLKAGDFTTTRKMQLLK